MRNGIRYFVDHTDLQLNCTQPSSLILQVGVIHRLGHQRGDRTSRHGGCFRNVSKLGRAARDMLSHALKRG